MRKESSDIASAFLRRKPCTKARTHTNGDCITLHGNKIAWWNEDGSISMTLAGWGTATTRDRLNTLCVGWIGRKPFHQKKSVQYYLDEPITPNQVITVRKIELITL